MRPQAFFLPIDGAGQRFCLLHEGQASAVRGSVLYVHPFAEEMNKARRMAGMQARALAGAGYDVLQVDLLGCGDSSGEFGDADWQSWVEDVCAATQWLDARRRGALWLWGLRAGCLLAAQAAAKLDAACNFLFWQPAPAGGPLLHQFLRLAAAEQWIEGTRRNEADSPRARLAAGVAVEVGGYTLSPGLAHGLEQARLDAPRRSGRVEWIEVSSRADESALAPAAAKAEARWRASGWMTRAHIVSGPPFWQTVEIEEAPALIEASVEAIRGGSVQ
jgi:exosortase A-associated hydrolase 2